KSSVPPWPRCKRCSSASACATSSAEAKPQRSAHAATAHAGGAAANRRRLRRIALVLLDAVLVQRVLGELDRLAPARIVLRRQVVLLDPLGRRQLGFGRRVAAGQQ